MNPIIAIRAVRTERETDKRRNKQRGNGGEKIGKTEHIQTLLGKTEKVKLHDRLHMWSCSVPMLHKWK